jgi:4-deoxy-L-threo-5-hexosulose-uronate ketol-isomerase
MTEYSSRYAAHPQDFSTYDTGMLREQFLIEDLFENDRIKITYTHYDRYLAGGAKPHTKSLLLETIPILKANYFLERRELGIINVGPAASVTADGKEYHLKTKEALYIGKGVKEVVFHPSKEGETFFYFNSAPAHAVYPVKKVSLEEAETVETGSQENCNHRTIRKLLINTVLPTCQLQMGLTELKPGNNWNTMPPHTHDRRMEIYFYFELPAQQVVCHFMGEPTETRHLWVKNHQAVISPPWSIHSGVGTSNYAFIWGMAGENLDYSDMDALKPYDLK